MLPLDFFLFLQIIIFLFITPGTPRIVIISYSMNYGVQKCIWTALGDITANFIQATLVIFVLGSFFSDNPNFLNILKWIGVIFLLYLAYDVYKTSPKDMNSKIISSAPSFKISINGVISTSIVFSPAGTVIKLSISTISIPLTKVGEPTILK